MNTAQTIFKAIGLSFTIFWGIMLTEESFVWHLLPYIFLSLIPIGLCCLLAICLSVVPFYAVKKETTNINMVYKTYFPFYTIVLFDFTAFLVIYSNFSTFSVACNTSAFFALLKSWSWIIQPSKTDCHETL